MLTVGREVPIRVANSAWVSCIRRIVRPPSSWPNSELLAEIQDDMREARPGIAEHQIFNPGFDILEPALDLLGHGKHDRRFRLYGVYETLARQLEHGRRFVSGGKTFP